MKKRCPELINLSDSNIFDIEQRLEWDFIKLGNLLDKKKIVPQGYRSYEHWTSFNMEKLFEAAESYLFAKGELFPGMDEEIYNLLRVFYSASV